MKNGRACCIPVFQKKDLKFGILQTTSLPVIIGCSNPAKRFKTLMQ